MSTAYHGGGGRHNPTPERATPSESVMFDRAAFQRAMALGPGPFAVYAALVAHAEPSGRTWPSQERLCQVTGLSNRTVRNHLKRLIAEGLLRVLSPGNGRGFTTQYLLPGAAGKVVDLDTKRREKVVGDDTKVVIDDTEKVVVDDTPEPTLYTSSTPGKERYSEQRAREDPYEAQLAREAALILADAQRREQERAMVQGLCAHPHVVAFAAREDLKPQLVEHEVKALVRQWLDDRHAPRDPEVQVRRVLSWLTAGLKNGAIRRVIRTDPTYYGHAHPS